MANVQHTCTGCAPIDASIMETYIALINTNESAKVAEAGRVVAETERVEAETQRTSTFATDHSRAVEDHSVAQSDHATAGSDHTTALSDHTTAQSDHATAGQDHARAESDHSTAVSDHGVAGTDHTTATGDHTTASADHSIASTDHTTAEADHTTAGSDHTRAGEDHTLAAADHVTAEADHATWAGYRVVVKSVGETAPASPSSGDKWYKTTDNKIYSYDGSSWDSGVAATTGATIVNSATNDVYVFNGASLFNNEAEVSQLQQKVSDISTGKYYGYYASANDLPDEADVDGFAYVGTGPTYTIYNCQSGAWTSSGLTVNQSPIGNEEDIDQDTSGKLQFADRVYNAQQPDGMGYVILRKDKTFAEQVTEENTIYEIRYDFTLGEDITVPANCVLEFDGGSISGAHTITGDNTAIQAGLVKILNTNVTIAGTWNIAEAYPEWWGAKGDGATDDSDAIQKAILMYCPVYFQCKCYGVSKQIDLVNSTFLKGCHTELTATEGTQLIGNTPDFDNKIGTIKALTSIDAVLNINGNCITIEGIAVDCDNKALYGIYSSEVNRSRIKIRNCYVSRATTANIRMSVYLSEISNTIVHNSPIGFKLGRDNHSKNTSLTLTNCYAKHCTIGYKIISYIYSSIISCACDSANIAYSFYDMNGCNMLDCGCEDIDIAIEINDRIIDFKIDGLYIGNDENRVNKAIVIHSTSKAYGNVYFGRLNYVAQGTGMCVQVPTTRHDLGYLSIYCDNTINKFACEGNFTLVESNKNLLDTIDGTITSTMQSAPTVTKIGDGKYIISESTISPGEQFEMYIAQIELEAGTYLLGNLNCRENYRTRLDVAKNNYGSGLISSCKIGDCSFTLDNTTTVYIAFWIQPSSDRALVVPAITLSPYLYKIG